MALQILERPVQNWQQHLPITVDQCLTEVLHIARQRKLEQLQKLQVSVSALFISFIAQIDLVLGIDLREHLVEDLEQFKVGFLIEGDKRESQSERLLVQMLDDNLELTHAGGILGK